MRSIYVSDVTLKAINDQNVNLTFREKLALAEKIDLLKVNAIELPSVIKSKENEVIYRTIAQSVKNATVKISVGNNVESLITAVNCVKEAKDFVLQVICPVSTAIMEYSYHVKAPVMLEKIKELVSEATKYTNNVEFVALDVFRAEEEFLLDCVKTAVEFGAKSITLCDDNGEALPEDYKKLVSRIKEIINTSVYVCPSNSLSLAPACAVEAINAGANGIVTSTYGNYLSLNVLSNIIKAKKYSFDIDCSVDSTNVNTVTDVINGITEKGNLSISEEASSIDTINIETDVTVIANVIKDLGYELSDSDIGKVFEEVKKVISKKEGIDKKELEAIIASTAMQVPSTYHLINYVVNSGNIIPATANVTLEKDGEKFTGVSTGDGPIDAAFHAIEQVVGHHYELDDFQVHAVTKGRGAVGSSIIRLRADGKLYPGNGVSTDIVGACIRAYINALNKIVYEEN